MISTVMREEKALQSTPNPREMLDQLIWHSGEPQKLHRGKSRHKLSPRNGIQRALVQQ